MGEKTGVSYVDHSWNPWWGCSSPAGAGCDNCFATRLDSRTGGHFFGRGTRPRLTGAKNRGLPFRWNRDAESAGVRERVLCGTMLDVFDRFAPVGAREELWETVKGTPSLDWFLLTKRVSNIPKYLPPDWADGYPNAALGCTVENRRSGLRRLAQLRDIPALVRFVSFEPLLEDLGDVDLRGIQFAVIGGESGPGCRLMAIPWAECLIAQCREQAVRVYFKQVGGAGWEAGGCLINGIEIKEWPVFPAANANRSLP
jgi:protein gp37